MLPFVRAAIASVVVAVTFPLTTASLSFAQEVKWTYLTILPPTHALVEPLVKSFERVKEQSNGRFIIQTSRYTETPHKPTDGMTILRDGLADMSEWYAGYVTNTHPMLAAAELPYLLPKFVSTREAIDAFKRAWSAPKAKAALDGVMDRFKIRIAARTYLEPIHMWSTAAVEKPYQIGGLKMRANTPENGLMINAIGGTAHFMPITDVYPAAQRNVISGLFTSVNAVLSLKLDEVTKFGTINNSQLVSGGYLVSKASQDKLPADLRKIFDDEMAAVDAQLFELVSKTDAQGLEQIASKGVTLRKVTDDEYTQLRKIAQEKVWPEWKKRAGPDADKALAEILAAVETK